MSRRLKITLGASLGTVFITWLVLGYIAAYLFTMPRQEDFPDRTEIAGFPVESVTISSEDGLRLSGWLAQNRPDRVVIFLAGITADRRQGLSRAEFYLNLGYSVLLLDLRGTGKSDTAVVTIGWDERKDLLAAYRYLRERGFEHIGAHGISLGAAAIAFSFVDIKEYSFAVLESCYDTLDHAFTNRLDMFHVPHPVTLPVRWFAQLRMGVWAARVQPLKFMESCSAPILIMAGDDEPELKLEETRALYRNCASPDKRLHIFEGGHHENFLRRYPEEYKTQLQWFLAHVSESWPDPTPPPVP